jgi:hypothetical protein
MSEPYPFLIKTNSAQRVWPCCQRACRPATAGQLPLPLGTQRVQDTPRRTCARLPVSFRGVQHDGLRVDWASSKQAARAVRRSEAPSLAGIAGRSDVPIGLQPIERHSKECHSKGQRQVSDSSSQANVPVSLNTRGPLHSTAAAQGGQPAATLHDRDTTQGGSSETSGLVWMQPQRSQVAARSPI